MPTHRQPNDTFSIPWEDRCSMRSTCDVPCWCRPVVCTSSSARPSIQTWCGECMPLDSNAPSPPLPPLRSLLKLRRPCLFRLGSTLYSAHFHLLSRAAILHAAVALRSLCNDSLANSRSSALVGRAVRIDRQLWVCNPFSATRRYARQLSGNNFCARVPGALTVAHRPRRRPGAPFCC